MRLLTLFKLRTTIPLIIILYSLVTGGGFLHSHLSWVNTTIEEEARANLQIRLTQIQRTLEYFLLRDDITTVQRKIATFSLDSRIHYAYLVCDQGVILAASNLGHINKDLASLTPTLPLDLRELFDSLLETSRATELHTSHIHLSADQNALLSHTALTLPTTDRQQIAHGHSHRHATLYLYHDLQAAKTAARQAIIDQVQKYSLFLALLALILWAYFDFVLGRRITTLGQMAKELGQGNYDAQGMVTGNDELAALARNFEEMRANLISSLATIRRREESLRETQEIARLGSWELDIDSQQLWWSQETYRIFNFELDSQVTFEKFLAAIHPEDRDATEETIQYSISQGTPVTLDYRIIRDDNTLRYLHEESQVVVDDSGRVIKRKGSVQDITERKEAELAIDKAGREWAVAMDASDDIMYLLDPDRHLLRANRLFYTLTNSSPETAVGRHIEELVHPEPETISCPVCQAQENKRDAVITMEADDPDNPATRPIEIKLKMIHDIEGQIQSMLITIHDLTAARQEQEDRSQLEKRLQQSQKMEAIGTLAGGIAHDFNNILTPIIGYTEMAIASLPEDSVIAKDLAEVLQAGLRAKDLVSHILTFSRQSDQTLLPLQMHVVIKETLKLLRASIPTTIEIKAEIDQQCHPVRADPTLVQQIIMNLCTNAYHAMRDSGGVLTVTLSQHELGADDLKTKPKLVPGNYVLLEVRDSGHGMSKEVRERIFDPYFTTKAKGEGTGLGLAVVHGIVTTLAGHISVTSELGKGSSFFIYLPVATEASTTMDDSALNHIPGGHERVLVVDDEESIATLITQILQSLGYQVSPFTSSEDALAVFKTDPQAFDLVITDMTMPHLTGDQLAIEVLKDCPSMPIVICTGFSEHISPEKAAEIGIRQLLMKPISKRTLAQAVRQALDTRTDSAAS